MFSHKLVLINSILEYDDHNWHERRLILICPSDFSKNNSIAKPHNRVETGYINRVTEKGKNAIHRMHIWMERK